MSTYNYSVTLMSAVNRHSEPEPSKYRAANWISFV